MHNLAFFSNQSRPEPTPTYWVAFLFAATLVFATTLATLTPTIGLAQEPESTPTAKQDQDDAAQNPDDEPPTSSASEEASPANRPTAARHYQVPPSDIASMQLVAMAAQADQVRWLETDAGQFLCLWIPAPSKPKGALVVVPAYDKPTGPIVEAIIQGLPQQGWSILALSAPVWQASPQPPRRFPALASTTVTPDGNEPNPDATAADTSASKPPLDAEAVPESELLYDDDKDQLAQVDTERPNNAPTENTMSEKPIAEESTPETLALDEQEQKPKPTAAALTEMRLRAAIAFLHQTGQFNNAVLGIDRTALYAAEFIESLEREGITGDIRRDSVPDGFRAIILLDARSEISLYEQELEGFLKAITLPVLELFLHDNPLKRDSRQRRKLIANNNRNTRYQQVNLHPLRSPAHRQRLGRRIRSFLDRHIAGKETTTIKK